MGIGARPGRRPGPGAMSDRGPTPCARGRCLPLIQPFSLVPALLSRAFNAAFGKRQPRKKHRGICLSLSLSLSPGLSYFLPCHLSLSPCEQSRESTIGERVKGPGGTIGATRQRSPLPHVGVLFTLLLLSLFFTCIHVLLKPIAHLTAPGNLTARAAVSNAARSIEIYECVHFIYLTSGILS